MRAAEQRLSEAAEITLGLVGIRSVSGRADQMLSVLEAIEDYFGRAVPTDLTQFDPDRVSKRVEGGDTAPDRMYNLRVGRLHDPDLVVVCNIDTVDYSEENWTRDPLGETGRPPESYERSAPIWDDLDDDRVIYGRGSVGGKSVTAAAMVAVRNAFRRFDDPSVMVLVEADFQRDFRGMKNFIDEYADSGVDPELVVIGASTNCHLGYRHKGLIHQRIELTGDAIHAPKANHPDAPHAAELAYPILAELEQFRHDLQSDDALRRRLTADDAPPPHGTDADTDTVTGSPGRSSSGRESGDDPEGRGRLDGGENHEGRDRPDDGDGGGGGAADEITFVTSKVTVGTDNNRVPGTFSIHTDARMSAMFDAEEIDAALSDRLEALDTVQSIRADERLGFNKTCYAKYDAVENDRTAPVMEQFQSTVREAATGRALGPERVGAFFEPNYFTELALWGQGFDAAGVDGFSRDDPRLIFGTGPTDKSHEPDEFVLVESIDVVQETFESAIERLCVD